MNPVAYIIIQVIKFYKYFVSPHFPSNCRYLPTCSEYFIDCLKINGVVKGSIMGIGRILRCHPIKYLGGGHGFDPVTKIKMDKK